MDQEELRHQTKQQLRVIKKNIYKTLLQHNIPRSYEKQKQHYNSFCSSCSSTQYLEKLQQLLEVNQISLPVAMASSPQDVYHHDRLIACCFLTVLPTTEGGVSFTKPLLSTISLDRSVGEEVQLIFYTKLLEMMQHTPTCDAESGERRLSFEQRITSIEQRLDRLETLQYGPEPGNP